MVLQAEPASTVTSAGRREALAGARLEINRRAALEAGSRLFASRGFQATTMSELANEAGLSLKALYEAFDGKEELFGAVIEHLFGAHLLPALQASRRDPDPGERIFGLLDDLLEAMESNRDYFLLYARGSNDLPAAMQRAPDPFRPFIDRLAGRLSELIADAQSAGMATHLPAETVSTALVSTVIGLARAAAAAEPPRSIAEVGPELRALYGPLLDGAGPPTGTSNPR